MPPLAPRILVIDDDDDNSELIRLWLLRSNADYDITCAMTPDEGLSLAATQRFDLFVLDYRLRGMTGISLCRTLRRTDPDTRIMFFTGEAHTREQQEAMQAGADAYLIKPNDLKNLTETVRWLLSVHQPSTHTEHTTERRPGGSHDPSADGRPTTMAALARRL
jgi:DNA-binding response OmpR family regulator